MVYMNFEQTNIDFLVQNIKENDTILLLAHDYPDGDSVGSIIAMAYILKSLKVTPLIVLNNYDQSNWDFIDFKHDIHISTQEEIKARNDISLTIVLDCSNLDRLGEQVQLIGKSKLIVNIDHHADNNKFGNINIVKESSSVGEIIYNLISKLNVSINREIAYCILVSIASDTGRFKYSNTQQTVFKIVEDLFNYLEGNDYADIMRHLYSEISLEKTQLTGLILKNLEMLNGFVAFSFLEKDCGFVDGLVESIQTIKGARASVMVRKIDSRIKISFRAKDLDIDVQELAKEFGGGGHIHAAGAAVELTNFKSQVQEIREKVTIYFRKYQ